MIGGRALAASVLGGVQEILRILDDFSESELLSPVMAALYSDADGKFEWIVLLHLEEGK
jgi:hypothetical protein